MERLTKLELRALLESIKERYPNIDLKTFSQHVVSRPAKIVLTEFTSSNRRPPHRRRNACAIKPHHAYHSSRTTFRQHARTPTLDSSVKDAGRFTRPIPQKDLSPGRNNACSSTVQRQTAFNRGNKDFADRDQLLLKLLSPQVHAYRNSKIVTHLQQKFTLVDDALNTLHLGLILLTPTGKVRLATACAVQQVTEYLGQRSLIGERLPESLWMWVKQQEAIGRKKADSPLSPSRLIFEGEGKRLVIRLVSDLDRILLLREEHLVAIKPQAPPPCSLSAREAQVLQWVSQGKTNKEIGVILELSPRTGVESRTGAAAKAYELRW